MLPGAMHWPRHATVQPFNCMCIMRTDSDPHQVIQHSRLSILGSHMCNGVTTVITHFMVCMCAHQRFNDWQAAAYCCPVQGCLSGAVGRVHRRAHGQEIIDLHSAVVQCGPLQRVVAAFVRLIDAGGVLREELLELVKVSVCACLTDSVHDLHVQVSSLWMANCRLCSPGTNWSQGACSDIDPREKIDAPPSTLHRNLTSR
eukprot:363790-Chlamydomonas_euryale.AAC.22